ncbi:MAG: hypothetical protein J2P25_06595 [Nocardiopsaceae bacterium]|nr:hypothetical protein [Nocardiopsaceae bacterium]
MVSAANNYGGGGPALRDRNLASAYDNLTWYRYLASGLGMDDPSDSLLTSVDWDSSEVEDVIEAIVKGKRDADDAYDEMDRVKTDVSEAWPDDTTLASYAQASVGTLAMDYDTFAGELGTMRKHMDTVVDGMHTATSGVRSVTERLKSQYGYMLNDPVPSPHDKTEVEQGKTRWQMAHDAVTAATGDLRRAIGEARKSIGDLAGHFKSDQDPVDMSYGPPPKSFHGL